MTTHRYITSASSTSPARRLVLVDIENLTRCALPTAHEVSTIRSDLLGLLGAEGIPMLVVACSHKAARVVRFSFPEGRHRWRSGEDGADLALLDVLSTERVVERFNEVVIASGDGIFADDVAALAAQGIRCVVISQRGSLSNRLRLAAHETIYLPTSESQEGFGNAA